MKYKVKMILSGTFLIISIAGIALAPLLVGGAALRVLNSVLFGIGGFCVGTLMAILINEATNNGEEK